MRFPHGGLEIGGILLGRRTADSVRVTEARPISIEYAQGPNFTLSEDDNTALRDLITRAGKYNVIGWYQSHARRDLTLSDNDIAIYDEHFRQPGLICLVVTPALQNEQQMAAYLRSDSGLILHSAHYEDVELDQLVAARPVEPAYQPVPVPEAAPEPVPDPEPVVVEEVYEQPEPPRFLPVTEVSPTTVRAGAWRWQKYAAIAAILLVCAATAVWLARRNSAVPQALAQNTTPAPETGSRNRAVPVAESVPPASPTVAPPADTTVTRAKTSSRSKTARHRRSRSRRRSQPPRTSTTQ